MMMFSDQTIVDPDFVKACCVNLYESDWPRLLLGDSFHPGGLELTARLGEIMDLRMEQRLLDVASGRGESTLYLAGRFGCEAIGIDYSPKSVKIANVRTAELGLDGSVRFEAADAETLPFADNSFDALICECAFCTFPHKERAAAEFARVLKPGGQIGLTDLTRSESIPPQLNNLEAWIVCIADALPAMEYVELLAGAGLKLRHHEVHDQVLHELAHDIRGKLIGVDLLSKLRKQEFQQFDIAIAKSMAKAAEEAVRTGKLGYALFVAQLVPAT